ncbi:S8 family peptidase [Calothrix sp. NIES-3974]|uniref:S8 family peptidase n=1 Tax=Calothrix sp. NIES-3974 TaxID=2005462 RepID=UPI000B609D0D|nr:S8 family serine peptidase [Calothrix sp. NIES-3974]BAZ03771.1 peptidase S8/S53 [Calothrix sp. NIES-3974]
MKPNLPPIFLISSLFISSFAPLIAIHPAIAQTNPSPSEELFYTFKGEKIRLRQRQDAIAVAFKQVTTRGTSSSSPLIFQLEQDLQKTGVRGGGSKPQVSSLGTNYAIVNIPRGVSVSTIQANIQQQPYVQGTLPVLTRENSQETIVLPQEIILRFAPEMSQRDRDRILAEHDLKLVRSLRYAKNFYLVRPNNSIGTRILGLSEKLGQIRGVSSATPNFIQSVPTSPVRLDSIFGRSRSANKQLKTSKSILPAEDYLGFQWHLDSTPLQQCLQQNASLEQLPDCLKSKSSRDQGKNVSQRTDLRVKEAWVRSPNKGKDVVVAVIDSLIQWNHPDLQANLHTITAADQCPGEKHGWDFSEPPPLNNPNPCAIGDNDTRANPLELTILKRRFQETFQLSDAEFLARYPRYAEAVRGYFPGISPRAAAAKLREYFRLEIGSEYHGTWVSGVIAAKPSTSQGLIGVAPNAKIVPVRVFGLNGSIFIESYLEALAYAAARGADVINLSLGAMMPNDSEQQLIQQILQEKPNLVIVASSGNSNYPQVGFPAGYDGVLSVGASNLQGNRAAYSNYGIGLDVIAPGGDIETPGWFGGIATTGGTWMEAYWQGLPAAQQRWGPVIDNRGRYWWVQGTSFSAPAVSGVVALMKGEDRKKTLNRDRILQILQSTASYQPLTLTPQEVEQYQMLKQRGLVQSAEDAQRFFFGRGLINAEAAVDAVVR